MRTLYALTLPFVVLFCMKLKLEDRHSWEVVALDGTRIYFAKVSMMLVEAVLSTQDGVSLFVGLEGLSIGLCRRFQFLNRQPHFICFWRSEIKTFY